jgi:uncharacterized protein (TIGR02598 family)
MRTFQQERLTEPNKTPFCRHAALSACLACLFHKGFVGRDACRLGIAPFGGHSSGAIPRNATRHRALQHDSLSAHQSECEKCRLGEPAEAVERGDSTPRRQLRAVLFGAPKHCRFTRAFTLVEVALAVAVTGFALIAILGLFSNGLQSSRGVANNAIAAAIGQNLINNFQSQSIATSTGYIRRGWPTITDATDCLFTRSDIISLAKNFYFNHDGSFIGIDTTNGALFLAACSIKTNTVIPLTFQLTVEVKWPLSGPSVVPPNTERFTTLVSFP